MNDDDIWNGFFVDNNPATGVLKNKFNIRDKKKLREVEYEITGLKEKRVESLKGNLDFEHYKSVHNYLFSNIYEWAGKVRPVDIGKRCPDGSASWFTDSKDIKRKAEKLFSELKEKNHLVGLNNKQFCKEMASFLQQINKIHPFREGNGRSMRVFANILAEKNNLYINWRTVKKKDREIFEMASIQSFRGNIRTLERYLEKNIFDISQNKEQSPHEQSKEQSLQEQAERAGAEAQIQALTSELNSIQAGIDSKVEYLIQAKIHRVQNIESSLTKKLAESMIKSNTLLTQKPGFFSKDKKKWNNAVINQKKNHDTLLKRVILVEKIRSRIERLDDDVRDKLQKQVLDRNIEVKEIWEQKRKTLFDLEREKILETIKRKKVEEERIRKSGRVLTRKFD